MSELSRRALCFGGLGLGAALAVRHLIPGAWAQAPAKSADARRLENRLELWGNYAKRTKNLTARYISTRQSSLLHEPLVRTGQMAFEAPERLIMRDDGLTGSSTLLDGRSVVIRPNESSVPAGPEPDPDKLPALAWLGERTLAMFAPGDGAALTAQSRSRVPRGRTPRLELLPITGSAVRKVIRSITVELDPVGGAVLGITIAEAQGDQVKLRFSDHRQNVDADELARVFDV